ncbi:MAG: tyrosine-type recombinase/integrase [Eubacteriales bacterium]|nr:tyrosine-type recombinase/integrase [Eubacteriales bacterium]
MRKLNDVEERLVSFRNYLEQEEKSPYTVEKYLRDTRRFLLFCEKPCKGAGGLTKEALTKEALLAYKEKLKASYCVSSVNSILNAINCYLKSIGKAELRMKLLRQQRRIFCDESRILKRSDYKKLVRQADLEKKTRLSCILQTLGMTGIRIGELQYITCGCIEQQIVHIERKGKMRDIVLSRDIIDLLKEYCRKTGIRSGIIFRTKSGKPVDRKNVWKEMKALCRRAGVAESKVFPHNFRHLFAYSFYERTKDIVRLADYLGHSSLDTTRRYTTISTKEACQRELDLGLFITGRAGKKSASRSARMVKGYGSRFFAKRTKKHRRER